MGERAFDELVDETLERIEDALESADDDIDCDNGGGVLTITFSNGTSMIFSRQAATAQLWLAAKSGGFHYEYDPAQADWRNTRDGSLLQQVLPPMVQAQAGIVLEL